MVCDIVISASLVYYFHSFRLGVHVYEEVRMVCTRPCLFPLIVVIVQDGGHSSGAYHLIPRPQHGCASMASCHIMLPFCALILCTLSLVVLIVTIILV